MKKTISTLRADENLKGTNRFKMDLQLFADPKDGDDPEPKPEDTPEDNGKTYTQEEFERALQSETDKRVTEAIKTNTEKLKKELKEEYEKEKKEAQRLAELSAKEREEELRKQREAELEERENQIKYRELQIDTVNILNDKEMPIAFADFVIGVDAETTNENIKILKEEWQKELEKAVNEKLAGTSPKNGGGNPQAVTSWAKVNKGYER